MPTSLRICSASRLESAFVISMKKTSAAGRHSSVLEYATYKERCTESDFHKMVELGIQIPGVNGA